MDSRSTSERPEKVENSCPIKNEGTLSVVEAMTGPFWASAVLALKYDAGVCDEDDIVVLRTWKHLRSSNNASAYPPVVEAFFKDAGF